MKRRENIIIIVVLVVMVIAIVGVSYAAFNYSRTGSKVNTITTGAITMTYKETDNTISLTGALPTTDKTGMVRLNPGEYFDFSISSEITGDVNINYEISAKDITDSGAKKIDGKYIKLYLTKLNGESEDGLMAPETYNEETSENTYTGRPSGEMSLYTSSMNSSESNNYRLRMYVDESYNPQGDGGNLQFTVQINVYGKAGDKYVPLTTQKILEDNELQEEKTNMFNYASNGDYYDKNTHSTLNNPEYITNGLYSTEDEDGTSYYYRGNVDNNYVQFGEYTDDYYVYRVTDNWGTYDYVTLDSCQYDDSSCSETNRVLKYSAGTPMYWRIVRVNGDGSLRLIYNGTSTSATYLDLMIGVGAYNFDNSDPKYTGYTYDRNTNEIDSNAKKDIDTWYKNALSETAYDKMITKGRFCSDSSGYNYDGKGYFASYDRLAQAYNNFAKANSPTLKCPTTTENYGGSYRLKAGLITADELAFSGFNYQTYNSNSSYLANDWYFFSMTPNSFYKSAFVWNGDTGIYEIRIEYGDLGLRPVINVMPDNGFASGDGTVSNPYVIN